MAQHRSVRLCLLITSLCLLLTACESGKAPEKTWKYAAQGILSADISQGGEYAVIGSIHHGGSLWEIEAGERVFNWNHKPGEYSSLRAVALSGDGSIAATAEFDTIGVWSTESGKSVGFWRAPDKILAMTVSPRGDYALISLPNNTVSYFNLEIGQGRYSFGHDAEIMGLGLSADGDFAVTGSSDNKVKVWSLSSGTLAREFQHDNQVRTVAISPDGSLIFASAQREDAIIWDVDTGKLKVTLDYHYPKFTSARFSSDGKRLLLGTFQGRVALVDVKSGKELKAWQAKPRQAWGAASSKAILALAFAGPKYYALASDGMMNQLQ